MIKLCTIGLLSLSTLAAAEARHYKAEVCYDTKFTDCEILAEYDYEYDDGLDARGRGKNGSGLRHLVDTVFSFIGDGFKGVDAAITALESKARASGYTKFTATMSGPKGSVTFTYDLRHGDWSVSKKSVRNGTKPLHGNEPGEKKPRVAPEE